MSEYKILVNDRGYKQLLVKDAKFLFKTNFEGRVSEYNDKGNRSFNLVLDEVIAETLKNDGWLVKTYIPKNGNDPILYTEIKANFRDDDRDPIVEVRVDGSSEYVRYDIDMLQKLDNYKWENVDLRINPYSWVKGSKSGTKGYLLSLRGTIQRNAFDDEANDFFGESDLPW